MSIIDKKNCKTTNKMYVMNYFMFLNVMDKLNPTSVSFKKELRQSLLLKRYMA